MGRGYMDVPYMRLLDFLTVAEFAQAILLIFILLIMEKNKKANIFFGAFLFILSSNFFSFYLSRSDIKILTFTTAALSVPGISILGTLIYLYALFMTGLLEKFRIRYLAHFVIYFINFVLFTTAVYNIKGASFESETFKKTIFIILSIGFVNSIVYMVYTLVILKRYYKKIENYYSDIEKMNLNWVMKITSLSFIVLAFWCISFWFTLLGIISKSPVNMAFIIIMFIIINFITAFYLINQPEIFKQNLEMNREIDDEPEIKSAAEKYAKQSVDERMQDEYMMKLNSFMDMNKPYLDENITIKDISHFTGIPSHHLSIVINNRLNKNFYTFINEYRIRESQEILKNPENSDASILSIAFKSGFNSKSTFNSTFKKITGLTPSEYRESMILKSGLTS
jgi:AraC-like DNA-binding protein